MLAHPDLFAGHDARLSTTDLVAELERFTFSGERTQVRSRQGIAYLFNEFWTARQRQGHALHEISYRACFKPQLPEFFVSRLTRHGDCVYDPFMGRGTTLLQAALMGRRVIGNDINPLSPYLCRPRLNPPPLPAIRQRLSSIPWTPGPETGQGEHDDFLVFYHPDTLREILALRDYLIARESEGLADSVDDWLRMVALNRLTGHSSGFFSVYSLPPNQAVSVESQRRINAKRGQTPPYRNVAEIILKKSKALLKDGGPPGSATGQFLIGPADQTSAIKTGAVDLVVTSPPFLDIVQYAADNWLRCWFAGIDMADVAIAMHRKPADWMAWIRKVLVELARVVRVGGHVAFEVGEVRGGAIELDRLVLEAMIGLPFEVVCVVVNVQEFTKTANCWGVDNNSKGTNTNRIIVARRTGDRAHGNVVRLR